MKTLMVAVVLAFTVGAAGAAMAQSECKNCGSVDRVEQVAEQEGASRWVAPVVGGVAGGLVGSLFGGGSGKTAMTVLGAAGGAYAGHRFQQSQSGPSRWSVVVRMDDGSLRTFSETADPGLRSGDRVRVVSNRLERVP
jgi:outer membrane lipoprotein SlyB